jgi:hypothetical protein
VRSLLKTTSDALFSEIRCCCAQLTGLEEQGIHGRQQREWFECRALQGYPGLFRRHRFAIPNTRGLQFFLFDIQGRSLSVSVLEYSFFIRGQADEKLNLYFTDGHRVFIRVQAHLFCTSTFFRLAYMLCDYV